MFKQFFYKRHLKKLLAEVKDPLTIANLLGEEIHKNGLLKLSVVWPAITVLHKFIISTRYKNATELYSDLELIYDAVRTNSYLTALSVPNRPSAKHSLYEWCQNEDGISVSLIDLLITVVEQIHHINSCLKELSFSEIPREQEYAKYIRRKGTHVFEAIAALLKAGISIDKDQPWLLNQ